MPQPGGPAAVGVVVAAASEFGVRPAVQLHRFRVHLQPVPQHVLGDIFRPGRRERHIGQVVDLDLIVQSQRMIPHPPVVADARKLIDHQRIDIQLAKARRDRQAVLAAADNQHLRIAVGVCSRLVPLIQPVQAAEIPRIGVAAGPARADPFLVAFQFVERGHQHPGLRGCRRGQPDHAEAAASLGFEAENRLVDFDAKTADDARRRAALGQREAAGRRWFSEPSVRNSPIASAPESGRIVQEKASMSR